MARAASTDSLRDLVVKDARIWKTMTIFEGRRYAGHSATLNLIRRRSSIREGVVFIDSRMVVQVYVFESGKKKPRK